MLAELYLPLLLAIVGIQLPLLLLARLLGRPLRPLPVAFAIVLPLVLLAPWLRSGRLLAPLDVVAGLVPGVELPGAPDLRHRELSDAFYQFLPWELDVRHSLADRRLPLWSDLIDGGSSPWSNPSAQVLSPIALLARAAPIQHFLLVSLVLKVLVAAEGTWVLCRLLGARSSTALVGATAFALGGGIVAWSLFPHSAVAAWAPWLAAAALTLVRRPTRGGFVALALLTAVIVLSGHPETALAAACFAGLLGLTLRRRRDSWWAIGRAALAALVGGALAGPHMLSFLATTQHSLRASERLAAAAPVFPGGGDLAGWFAASGHRLFAAPLSPDIFGTPYLDGFSGPFATPVALSAYTGLAAFCGALAALGRGTRRRAIPLLAFFASSLLLSAHLLPLDQLLFLVPPLRLPELSRFLPVGCLALAAAGALGWERIARSRRWLPRGLALAALAPAVVLTPTRLVIVVALLVAASTLPWRRARRVAPALVVAALLFDLVCWARPQLPTASPAASFPPSRAMQALARELDGGAYRAVGEDLLVYPSSLAPYGIADPRPHNPLAPVDQLATLRAAFRFAPDSSRYSAPFENVEHPLLDFLNVRVVVSNRNLAPKRRLTRLTGVYALPFQLYRNDAALPRWFLPMSADVVALGDLHRWLQRLDDGRRVALMTGEVDGWRPLPRPWDPAAVRSQRYAPGDLALAVAGDGERLLATSVPGPRGWRAQANGRDLPVLTVNGAYLGVRVPAGARVVELRYLPPGLLAGVAAAAAALVLLAFVALPLPGYRQVGALLLARK